MAWIVLPNRNVSMTGASRRAHRPAGDQSLVVRDCSWGSWLTRASKFQRATQSNPLSIDEEPEKELQPIRGKGHSRSCPPIEGSLFTDKTQEKSR
jgi:hypothetical protein